jgi:hypothetical protein
MDPARIAFHEAKGAEVSEGCGGHTRNGGGCLEEDDPLIKSIVSQHMRNTSAFG